MLQNYLKIAMRNLIRHKIFTFINIFGLAVGMACTILILLWVKDELSYDRFHKNADNIYLVIRCDKSGQMAVTSKMLAPTIKEEFPEIKKSTCFIQLPDNFKLIIQNGNKAFEENAIFASPNFFNLFTFNFKTGIPETALSDPHSIVVTEKIAEKYFGNEAAIGKTLVISAFGQKTVMRISGILDNVLRQSQIQSNIILSANWFKSIGINFDYWDDQSFHTYVLLNDKTNLQYLSLKIKQCEIKNYPNQNTSNLSYKLFPITKIHLYGNNIKFIQTTGDIKYVKIFLVIAIFILLIASINYMNLTTALALKRTKEIGIKKTVGANKRSLIFQFFGESIILSFISYIIAVLLIETFLPEFNQLSGKKLSIRYFELDFLVISSLIIIFTSILSGCYPSFLLSSFNPIEILKGKLKLGKGSMFTRKGLVVCQFVISITIILSTIIVLNQLAFIINGNLGFDKENILCIKTTGEVNSKFESIKNEIQKNPQFISLSRSEPISSSLTSTTSVSWQGKPENEEKHFWVLHSDFNLAATYKIQLEQGRFFSEQYSTDKTNAYVVNEAAVKSMEIDSPLDKEIELWGKKGRIIGIAKDFHFASLHNIIEPLIFKIPDDNQQAARFSVISIRFKSQNPAGLISFLEKIWHEKMPDIPFNYYFYNDSLNELYHSEIRMSIIFKYFSFMSILIACLGLFGLTSISVEQRTKEIGIRKVLGASISSVAVRLSKEFLIWVALSNIMAFPVAWYFMHNWLQDFAYKTSIVWWMFALAGGIALLIAILTVGLQAIKAALANPVESLKYE